MAVNVREFKLNNVIDTCAVWHVLMSRTLYNAAKNSNCHFCCTDFVIYECLYKERKTRKENDVKLMSILKQERSKKCFGNHSISLEDLQAVEILKKRKNLGKGEISSIIFAKKTRQAFMTDDQKARRLAAEVIDEEFIQTTPHLLGWLFYEGHLTDSDKGDILKEHKELGGRLEVYFEETYYSALEAKLADRFNSKTVGQRSI